MDCNYENRVVTVGAVLLSAHVVAAILFIGPVTVAVSLFPRYARQALAEASRTSAEPVTHLLHRISRVYSVLGLAVPVLGLALAIEMGVLGDVWLLTSIGLTVGAGVLLAAVVLPAQHRAMALLDAGPRDAIASAVDRWLSGAKRLSMSSGVFALLWVVVVVLMIVRPGSTTGV